MKKVNAFENSKVLTVKDLYDKMGPRAPKMKTSGNVAIFDRNKIKQISLGLDLVEESYADQVAKENEVARLEPVEPEPAPAAPEPVE